MATTGPESKMVCTREAYLAREASGGSPMPGAGVWLCVQPGAWGTSLFWGWLGLPLSLAGNGHASYTILGQGLSQYMWPLRGLRADQVQSAVFHSAKAQEVCWPWR